MSFHRQLRRSPIRRVALGLAVAAIVVPSAQAMDPGGHPYAGTGQSAAAVLTAGQAYGELAQLPGAGLTMTSTYGELHQFPGAGLAPTPAHIRNIRPTILGSPQLPAYSVDGPRTAPDAVVRPPEPVAYGNRGGRVPPRYPVAIAPSNGTDSVWPAAGIAIAIGVGALAAFAGALVFGGGNRRRGTLQGA